MKKIDNIIDNCKDCKSCQRFNPQQHGIGSAFMCERTQQLITVAPSPYQFEFPSWCPLETYAETEQTAAAQPSDCSTIILPGMPHLEWMTENLTGFGGTEMNGRWYYTYDEAVEAVKQLGNGWRVPTHGEMVDLCDLGSTWDDERKGRWFGGNHDTDHAGSLFLPAAGLRNRGDGSLSAIGTHGHYRSSSTAASGSVSAGCLNFTASYVYPLGTWYRALAYSVRCVRNRQ